MAQKARALLKAPLPGSPGSGSDSKTQTLAYMALSLVYVQQDKAEH